MGEAKRRGSFENRKKSAVEKRFNENKSEVIAKMIEFGVYEKSLEREDWFVVHGNYLFTWKDGEYNYLYSTKRGEIEKLVEMFEFYSNESI